MTELDHCVLGVVWREGPLTAYAVRGRFAVSVNTAWSSSTGSIYPAIRRLTSSGLVRGGSPSDGRKTQLLSVTPKGLATLHGWLQSVTPGLTGLVADPVRTRVQFLAALSREAVLGFLDAAEEDCRSAMKQLEAREREYAKSRTREEHWGMIGAVYELRGRWQWLKHLRRLHVAGASKSPSTRRPRRSVQKARSSRSR